MSTTLRFHPLPISCVRQEAAGAVVISFALAPALHRQFGFEPGQYLTLRASIGGVEVRRSYSICSTRSQWAQNNEIEVGIRPMQGGVFSNWAATVPQVGDTIDVMPAQGRFVSKRPRAVHRVGFAAGSGITPILSIMASSLQEQADAKFTLVYGNRSMASVMFNEALQDLKDRYPERLTLIHVLSRQAQEVDLLQGRIDGQKVRSLINTLLPVASMDEVFVCGPEAMIEATCQALKEAGVKPERVHSERFSSPTLDALDVLDAAKRRTALTAHAPQAPGGVALKVVLDGKTHALQMEPGQRILDVALAAGLDLPYSCRGGVCCTCRAKLMEGTVLMVKNFTLEPWETDQGFVLSCQARPTSAQVTLSFDER